MAMASTPLLSAQPRDTRRRAVAGGLTALAGLGALALLSSSAPAAPAAAEKVKYRDWKFETSANNHLLIDMDPGQNPDLWKGAGQDGEIKNSCHKFSMNDDHEFLGDTKTPTASHNSISIKPSYPGGVSNKMMAFETKYCDISRGSNGGNGKDGSACYRSEWTINSACRKSYLQHEGEYWFGFSMYIPEKLASGMAADSKNPNVFKMQAPKVAAQMKSRVTEKLDKDGAKRPEFRDDTDWVFATQNRNWLDLFQIHHGEHALATLANTHERDWHHFIFLRESRVLCLPWD